MGALLLAVALCITASLRGPFDPARHCLKPKPVAVSSVEPPAPSTGRRVGDGDDDVRRLAPAGSLDQFWKLLDAWCDHMRARELTDDTIDQRESYLLRFFRRTRASPEAVTEATIEQFLAGVTPRSSQREAYVYALRTFYRWAASRGYVPSDPTTELRARSPKYGPADYFRPEEVRAILEAARSMRPAKAYWAILLLFETGGRIGSVAGVRPQDTGTVSGERLRFERTKGDRPYSVTLSPAAAEAVRELLRLHEGGETLLERHEDTLGEWFRTAARAAGMAEGRVHAHLARHTALTIYYRRTKDPIATQRFGGHADVRQLERYVANDDEVQAEALRTSLTG